MGKQRQVHDRFFPDESVTDNFVATDCDFAPQANRIVMRYLGFASILDEFRRDGFG
jgi:hypothetical protein